MGLSGGSQLSNKTTTITKNKVDVWQALSDAEERTVRMRHGISLRPEDKLELRGQEHPEARAQLAFIEQQALEALSAPRRSGPTADPQVKSHIIARLRD
ncbi:MAG: hypothetical protein ACI9WU_004696 [Myxococcota bacterium]